MAKQDTDTEIKSDEFSKIFNEYRAKIEEITRRTEKSLRSLDKLPDGSTDDENEHIEVVSAANRPEAVEDDHVEKQAESAPSPAPEPAARSIEIDDTALLQAEPAPSPAPEPAARPTEIDNTARLSVEPAPSPIPELTSRPVEIEDIARLQIEPVPSSAPGSSARPGEIDNTPRLRADPAPSPVLQSTARDEEIDHNVQVPGNHARSLVPEPPRRVRETNSRIEVERLPFAESAEILHEARYEAKRIIQEAEESAKKEAKKRTQSQVNKIIEKAKKEADEIIDRASRHADKVRDGVLTESKQEAERIIREITQKYRQDTEMQVARTVGDAQEKAEAMLSDITASTQQIGQLITEIVNRARKTINELETNLQADAAELTRIITETQFRLEKVNMPAYEEKPPPVPQKPNEDIETRVNPTLAIRLIGERSNGKNGTAALFSGQMEMKSISASFDYQYLKKLKKYLVHIPNIKYLQEYASEKEMSVVFDIMEPLPLLDILSNIPMVDEVITRADDDICLIFKDAE